MEILIWHHIYTDYDFRLQVMSHPITLADAMDRADTLTLEPMV
jgi:hypothetical protein